jgi:photosystem II stability/assembly factor-like uncharacterized protein
MRASFAPTLLLAALVAGCSDYAAAPAALMTTSAAVVSAPTLTPQTSNTTQGLIAVSPVDANVVWASGRGGTYVVTTDGGATWRSGVVPGAEGLQFRDVEAKSAREAYLLSIGTGTDSRIYHTDDGGATWQIQFTNQDPNGFYDCFAFFGNQRALVMGDAVAGRFPILRSNDGRRWADIGDRVPAAQDGEFAFASSGTCIATFGGNRAWFGTGGAPEARIYATGDGGNHWAFYNTPLRGSPSAGIFSVAFRDKSHGIIAGGDLDPAAPPFETNATTSDGGATWTLGGRAPIGTVFGVSYVKGAEPAVVATGPGGSAWSGDEGASWTQLAGQTGFWGVAFASPSSGWLVGVGGTITKISFSTE